MRFMTIMIPKDYASAAPDVMPEAVGGYRTIQVKSKVEAVKWAKRCPMMNGETIEIRQVQEMLNFPADVQEAAAGFDEIQAKC
jgi:hypothetical protein